MKMHALLRNAWIQERAEEVPHIRRLMKTAVFDTKVFD